jgi:hypothetical protein
MNKDRHGAESYGSYKDHHDAILKLYKENVGAFK